MEHRTDKAILSLVFFSTLLLCSSSAVAAKVYKWVDENGEVHYSETLPPDFEDGKHDILDEQGIVRAENQSLKPEPPPVKPPSADEPKELPRDSSGMVRPKALLSDKQMQEEMDRFLLLKYESEQEIEDAMEVEIKQLEYDRRLLQNSRKSMDDSYIAHVSEAGDLQRAGFAVDEQKIKAIKELRSRLESITMSLAGLEAREVEIRQTFEAQRLRYLYLIETWSEEN